MGEAAKSGQNRATYEDLLKVPDHMVAEIIDGELIAGPRPASPHARAHSRLGHDVMGPFDREPGSPDGPGGWWIFVEPELHLDRDIVVPDLAGWRHERMPVIPNVAYFELAPDWVCEIVSPRTASVDRVKKMGIYARERAPYVWLLDPLARTLEVYQLDTGDAARRPRWIVASRHAGEETIRAVPFDAVELDMSRWWIDTGE